MGRLSRLWSVGLVSLASAGIISWSSAGTFAALRPVRAFPSGGTVTWVDAPSGPFADNFNPWSPNNAAGGVTSIFESLLYINLYTGSVTPKLATAYHYTNHHQAIVFNLRHGVKWSNGTAFTAKDVVFTFTMLMKNPGIDLNDLKAMISSVVENSPYQVTVHLKAPNVTDLYYIAGDTPIVPQTQWGAIKDPVTFTDPHPITTGPFKVGSVSREQLTLVRNPLYWNKPEPYISKIIWPAYISNNTAALAMGQGKFTMASQFVPSIKKVLLDRNPAHYGDWFPPVSTNMLFLNDATYPFNLLAFRQALNDVINRKAIGQVGEQGYEVAANAVGLPANPQDKKQFDQAVIRKYAPVVSVPKAKTVLKKAGFRWRGGHLVSPKGHPVSVTVLAMSGATDWVADGGIIVNELHALGISAVEKTPAPSTLTADLASGHFQAAIDGTGSGPGAYYLYYPLLDSAFTAPIGKPATSNFERWRNATTNRLLNQYVTTFSQSKQQAILDQLETIMAKDLPVIPLTDSAAWEQYNSTHIVGFPTAKNPYAVLAYTANNNEYILAQLHRK